MARLLIFLVFLGSARAQEAPPADAGVDAGEGLPGSGDRVKEMSTEAILRIARAYNAEGRALLAKSDPAGALAAFKYAFELSGQRDAEAANNAGFAWFRLNDRDQARQWYEKALALEPRRGIAWQNLAELYMGPEAQAEDLEQAARFLARAREFQGNKPFLVRLQARVAAQQGRFTEALRQYLAIQPQTDAIRLEIGEFLAKYARDDEAIEWLGRVHEPDLKAEAEQRIRALRLAQVADEFELSLSIEGVPAQARQYYQLAETLARRQATGLPFFDDTEAVRLLEASLRLAPLYADANILLGDLEAADNPRVAELAWLRALAVNGRNVDVLVRVADLYQREGRPTAAASFLARAVEVAPERNDLRLRLARAWRAAGNVQRALAHLETYLAESPQGVQAAEARALKHTLEQAAPSVGPEPPGPEPTPAEAAAVSRATRFIAEDRLKEALNELVSLPEGARGPRAHSLMAFIMRRLGRTDEAIAAYHASLADDRDQPAVLLALGELLLDTGQGPAAGALFEEAELAGAVEAGLALARQAAQVGDGAKIIHDFKELRSLVRAQARLEAYVAHPDAAYRSDAATLLREVRGRVQGVFAVGGVAALVLLGGLGLGVRRRWGGHDLEALVTRAPEAGPEVQRVLSAIRHEVLKHNTMVLTGLVEAIRTDEPDCAAKAAWARRSLLGDPAGGDARDAAGERLRDYADDLERIGRSHGLRLNLERRDRALSALLHGFRLLAEAAPALDRYSRLGRRGRRRLERRLEHATRLLNVEGYEAVRALLDRLRLLHIDRGLLEAIYHRTRREPAFAGVAFAPLALEDAGLPLAVAMPRHAFEDVVANLLRNAIQASVASPGPGGVHIGLSAQTEVDPITGLAWLALRVRDRAPQALGVEVLRGRFVEEGLGLTAELVSRYEGALDVEADTAPWQKAVVVRLPRVEEEEAA